MSTSLGRLAATNWNTGGSRSFPDMIVLLAELLDDSFQIVWEYLGADRRTRRPAIASRFLSDTIETMIRHGQKADSSFLIAR